MTTRTLTIAAPRALADAASQRATDDGVSVAAVVRRALRAWSAARGVTLRGPTVADGRPQHGRCHGRCQARRGGYLPVRVPEAWLAPLGLRTRRQVAAVVRLAVAAYLGVTLPERRRSSTRRAMPVPSVSAQARALAARHADDLGAVSAGGLADAGLSHESRRRIARDTGRARGWLPLRVLTGAASAPWVVWAATPEAAEEYAACLLRPRVRQAA